MLVGIRHASKVGRRGRKLMVYILHRPRTLMVPFAALFRCVSDVMDTLGSLVVLQQGMPFAPLRTKGSKGPLQDFSHSLGG